MLSKFLLLVSGLALVLAIQASGNVTTRIKAEFASDPKMMELRNSSGEEQRREYVRLGSANTEHAADEMLRIFLPLYAIGAACLIACVIMGLLGKLPRGAGLFVAIGIAMYAAGAYFVFIGYQFRHG